MKRGLKILVLLIFAAQIMAVADEEIPESFRNNNYYRESLRLANLARLAYAEGDYDASAAYSEEAIRYASLSDEYVQMRLKMWETDKAINAAAKRLDYASSINAASRYPAEYREAQAAYAEARSFRAAENWDEAIEAAHRVFAILAIIDGGAWTIAGGQTQLPAQYTVRAWGTFKDCLWNIAGRPWVYNDPFKWKILYEANKDKMPESDNPDLINLGMVLDIPCIKGELRQGMWEPGRSYAPLP
jgi:nucleoid-associated protein YgaU